MLAHVSLDYVRSSSLSDIYTLTPQNIAEINPCIQNCLHSPNPCLNKNNRRCETANLFQVQLTNTESCPQGSLAILISYNLFEATLVLMDIKFDSFPRCLLHEMEAKYLCSCSTCGIPNPLICGHPDCIKPHGHATHQIISLGKLQELLQRNTGSLQILLKQTRAYYKEVRESIDHEIEKISDMMGGALELKHTHPVITLLKSQRYSELTPQRMSQLISYLRGAKTERNSMEFIKNQIYEELENLEKHRIKLLDGADFKKLMLLQKIDMHATHELQLANVSTSILASQHEYSTIVAMLAKRFRKHSTEWDLLYRASENAFSASSYLLNIEQRGPLLMLFKTDTNRKFGCFINSKVDKKEGWLTDGPGLSFIFSLDHNEMYPIKQQAKCRVKAAYIGDKGPQIGSGCDIYISDNCSENEESGSNLGGSFELPPRLQYGSAASKERLAGTQNFRVIEYEVYELK